MTSAVCGIALTILLSALTLIFLVVLIALRAYGSQVPADSVTSSGSGLDPHISPENALIQMARVAKARGLEVAAVQTVVGPNTDPAWLGLLGDPGVNVLKSNLALDKLSPPALPAP